MQNVSSEIFPYPSKSLSIGSHTLRYLDEGPSAGGSGASVSDADGKKRAILCVHGNPTWSFYWRKVVERFSPTHRVVAVDHMGCGRSDKPDASEFDYSLASHRDNVVRLIDELDLEDITLVAHDWGGAIGLSAMLERRERLKRIVLLNTGAFPPPYIPLRISLCRFPVLGTFGVRGLNLFAKAAITMAMSRQSLSPEAASGLLAPYDSWENRVAIDAFVKDIPMKSSHPTHAVLAKLEEDLQSLSNLPSLLVWGMKDWCFRPECLRRFQSHWPNAQSVEIHDAGHYVIEDAPAETLAAIEEFLESDANRNATTSRQDAADQVNAND